MSKLFNEPKKSPEEIQELRQTLNDFASGKTPPPVPSALYMGLRDYFAGQVISSMITDDRINFSPQSLDIIAWRAYMVADAMIKARSEVNQNA